MPPPESSVPSRENRPPPRGKSAGPPDGSRRCDSARRLSSRQAASCACARSHVLGWTTAFKRARASASSKTILARAALSIFPSLTASGHRSPTSRTAVSPGARTSRATSSSESSRAPHSASAAATVDLPEPIPPASVTMSIGFSFARRRGRHSQNRRPRPPRRGPPSRHASGPGRQNGQPPDRTGCPST